MSELLLSTNGLTKQYGHHKAVDKVNLHIKKGAIYGFIGRNGAGKTTCLKMISGLARPTAGEIEMFGCKGKELERIRSRVGCLIEAPGLYGNMNAYTNLKIKCELFGIRKKGYIEDILETVGLGRCTERKNETFFPWNEAASSESGWHWSGSRISWSLMNRSMGLIPRELQRCVIPYRDCEMNGI